MEATAGRSNVEEGFLVAAAKEEEYGAFKCSEDGIREGARTQSKNEFRHWNKVEDDSRCGGDPRPAA